MHQPRQHFKAAHQLITVNKLGSLKVDDADMEPNFSRLKKKLGKDSRLSQSLFINQHEASASQLPTSNASHDLSATDNYLLDAAIDSRLTVASKLKASDRRVKSLTKDVLKACGVLRKKRQELEVEQQQALMQKLLKRHRNNPLNLSLNL